MRAFFLTLIMTSLICGGCSPRYSDCTLYQLSGRQKPIVAVLPVVDHTEQTELVWDLSREFTDEIRKRVYNSKRIYLLREGGNIETAKLLSTPNPQAIAKSSIDDLGSVQFVVVTELLEQKEAPFSMGKNAKPIHSDAGMILSVGLRVRVIDVRRDTPKIILQEVLEDDFVVARAYMQNDYARTPWGSEAFSRTPMGMAHIRLVKELVSRVEAYIEATL
jgi:hypothetical protein